MIFSDPQIHVKSRQWSLWVFVLHGPEGSLQDLEEFIASWRIYLFEKDTLEFYRILNVLSHIVVTRVICGLEKEYQERLGALKWPSLELRRKFTCLVHIDPHMFFDFNVLSKTRRNHNFKIRPKKTRTNYFKFSFFNRYITDWNSIPSNIMHASSLSSFKSYLLDHLFNFKIRCDSFD